MVGVDLDEVVSVDEDDIVASVVVESVVGNEVELEVGVDFDEVVSVDEDDIVASVVVESVVGNEVELEVGVDFDEVVSVDEDDIVASVVKPNLTEIDYKIVYHHCHPMHLMLYHHPR